MITEPTSFSAESYFATQPPPSTLENDIQRVREWIQQQVAAGRRVVLVTVSPDSPRRTHVAKFNLNSLSYLERRYNCTPGAQRVSHLIIPMQEIIRPYLTCRSWITFR